MAERLRRAPAIPLVTHDPYFSTWCFADRLTDDWSRHWTGTKMALYVVARIDGVAWRLMGGNQWLARAAEQVECRITATATLARFRAGAVELELEFLSPLLVDDLELLSRPVTYLTVRARSLDVQARRVEVYVDLTGEWCVNLPHERVYWDRHLNEGLVAMSFRHEFQPVLVKSGDHLRIDWGAVFLAGPATSMRAIAGDIDVCRDGFVRSGELVERGLSPPPRKVDYNRDAIIAISGALDCRPDPGGEITVLIGYDDEWAIELFGQPLRAWWRRHRGMDGLGALALAWEQMASVRQRCREFDAALDAKARALAGDSYGDLCALAWRHSLAAHKLCAGPDGRPLLFSKENFSNGCIATIDVTYPSAPLFLAFAPELLEAMIDPYFAYCASPDWPFPFAAHDLGTYPKANGQTYRGFDKDKTLPIIETQMPIEECGNMLILVGALARVRQDASYARRHWGLLRQWADYLVETGADPRAQLCTDDFSGVLGHNVNLSGKATVGLGCAAMLAWMLGDEAASRRYREAAEAFAAHLLAAARDGDATRLAYDQPGSWSLKYNLVWDRLLGLELFAPEEMRRELGFYRGQAQVYGVPLDNRSPLTKPEWMLWAASLTEDRTLFADWCERIVRYANETPNRVPLSDLYLTDSGRKVGFQARSVLGGLFIAFLDRW